MVSTNDLKLGITIELDGAIYSVLDFLHVKPGKGAAFVKTKLKNLRTGSTIEKTFNSGIKLATARIDKQNMQYLYNINDVYYFMDLTTYEQLEIKKEQIEDSVKFLIENLEVIITSYEGEILGVQLPDKLTVKVIQTDTATKGNTTNNALKDAIVETGLLVKVPLFIDQDEEIIISTSDGKYSSRA